MNCAQRLLYNGLNAGRTAALHASSVLAAERTVRSVPALRSGSAGIAVSGAYTGDADATIDIEIVDTTPTTPIISSPVFTGVGNGALSALAFSGAAQSFTLELVDAGNEEAYASVAFAGCKIMARAPGTVGNSITITVDATGLTYTPLAYSLISPLPKATRRSDAAGLDFGAAVMGADNLFPTTAKRIIFGDDISQVYRQAKQWTGTRWEYVFEPEIQRYIGPGERVSEVTGTYQATVADGVITPEVFSGIKTNYDLLIALNTLSTLVRVEGVIANDRAQGGQAAGELSLHTSAYAQPVIGNGSQTVNNVHLIGTAVASGAATEVVEARCWAVTGANSANAHLGAELWEVSGSVTGPIGNFRTGEIIAPPSNDWSFTIPSVYPNGYGIPRGEFTVESIDMVARASGEPPGVCPVGLAVGPEAGDQMITLTYTKRPSGDCLCDDMPVPDLSTSNCLLGPNNPNSSGVTNVSYDTAIQARMTALWDWYADLAESYSADHKLTANAVNGVLDESGRLAEARKVCSLLEQTAVKIASISAALTLWDACFTDVQAHFSGTADASATAIAAENIGAGDYVEVVAGRIYLATGVGSLSGSTPFASYITGRSAAAITAGATVDVEPLAFPASGYWLSSGLTIGDLMVVDPATPGTLAPYTGTGDVVNFSATATKADLLLINLAGTNPATRPFNVVYARFSSRVDAILASAGISPLGKSDASTVSDDGCWQDLADENYYWAVVGSVGGGYMPAFNNTPYFSSRNTSGHIASTREFAFQINVKCPSALKVGDAIRLRLGNTAWPSTYQVGDTILLPIIGASPLALTGGRAASLDQVWHVNGSVDGAFAPFTATAGSGSYSDGGLALTLTAGGIRFAKGDAFKFSAEGGHWHWRKNGGSWSGDLDIGLAPVSLVDGLSATIAPGAAPSFVPADMYKFAVRQPNAPGNVQTPSPFAWRWTGATATLDVDMGSATAFDAIAIARHQIPTGATVTLTAGSTQGATDVLAATALTVQRDTIAKLWDAPLSARWVRIALTGATGGAIGWVTIAQAFRPSLSAEVQVRRDYVMDRGQGINPGASLLGRGRSGSLNWTEGALSDTDADALVAMLDWVKSHGDEPIVFFYSPSRENESLIARVDGDSVELADITDYRASSGVDRRFQARIGLAAIMQ